MHSAGTGPSFEVTTGSLDHGRQFVVFQNALGDVVTDGAIMASDRLVSFAAPSWSIGLTLPSGTIAVVSSSAANVSFTGSASSLYNVVKNGLAVSGTLYVPLLPFPLKSNGEPFGTAAVTPEAGFGVRVGLWDSQLDGRFLENVQFVNLVTPFTSSAAGNIDFAANALAVTP